jgi:hypothetical protein
LEQKGGRPGFPLALWACSIHFVAASGASFKTAEAREDLGMRRYVVACEFYRPKRAASIGDCIRRFASEWRHPLGNIWIVDTPLSAADIRAALLPHLDFQDRVYISETGPALAEFNTLPDGGGKVTQIGEARARNRLLAGIFSRNGNGSRHLMGATVKSLKSA